ncbi:MAG: ABC transporter permease, partial [Lachnospiraceae bacterium]|nr:ABC transporter permease [Lachnospiraceae bacterium]
FSGVMAENMILDMTPFLNMIVGETADSCINVNVGAEEALLEKLEADWQVEKSYLYHSLTVSEVGGLDLMVTISDDFSRVNNQNVVLEGRFPKYENEMAIAAKYAKERGLQIGDEIWISTGGSKANYLISGFTQVTNNLGKDCLMTKEGYERLGELQNVSYYLNLAEGTDIEQFHKEIKEEFERDVNMTINIKTTIEGASAVYISLMTIIVLAILVLSMIVIVFVLYLLVRLMLGRKKQEYGILKALGFTSRQLMLLTALSFLPAMIGATVVGLVVSSILINPLIALFLEGIGIVKCTFFVPVGFVVAAGVGLVLFAFAVACLLSWRVKRISPKMLLAG